jgi:hypothetical protein
VNTAGESSERRIETQCYLTEPHTGPAECVAADEPHITELISDYVSGCGFASLFVVQASAPLPVPTECEALVRCCESILQDDGDTLAALQCFDRIDAELPPTAEFCSETLASYQSQDHCADIEQEPASGGEGGAGAASATRSLCCYQTCGYDYCL